LQDWQEELAKEENWQQQRIKELSVELRRVEVACESLFKYTRAGQGDPVKLITRRKDGLEFKTSSLFDLPGEDSVEREFYTALYEFIQNLEQELSQGQAPTATQAESPHSTGNPTATSSLRRVRGVERQRLHKGIKIGSVITERGEHLHICISNEVEKVAYFYNDREEVVGSVIFDWNDESRIATFILIDVRPDCKGRGYSSAMFEALLLGFRQGIFSEHPVLYFSTSVVTNPFAARVFAKYGFRPDAGEEGIILTVSKARGANGKFQVRDLFSGGFLQAN